MGAGTLFGKLKAANDAVCDAMMRRFQAESKRVTGAMAEARRKTDNAYRGLAHCVESFVYMQGREPYAEYIDFVNQLFRYYKQRYPATATGSGSSSTEEELEETEGETGSEEGSEGGAGTGSGAGTGGEQGSEETGGEQGSETGSETTEPKFTVTYIKGQYTWMTQQYAAGERIVPPAEPEAFRWVDVPEFMPDHDITIYAQYVG